MARDLGLASRRRVIVQTASGTVQADEVLLPSLGIAGSIELRDVIAVVLDLPCTLSGKGLLGLNVLGKLDMQIDGRGSRLILSQPGRRRRR